MRTRIWKLFWGLGREMWGKGGRSNAVRSLDPFLLEAPIELPASPFCAGSEPGSTLKFASVKMRPIPGAALQQCKEALTTHPRSSTAALTIPRITPSSCSESSIRFQPVELALQRLANGSSKLQFLLELTSQDLDVIAPLESVRYLREDCLHLVNCEGCTDCQGTELKNLHYLLGKSCADQLAMLVARDLKRMF